VTDRPKAILIGLHTKLKIPETFIVFKNLEKYTRNGIC
jgi:hypothetical protein